MSKSDRPSFIGATFGKLKVVDAAPDRISSKGKKYFRWRCNCACGRQKEIDEQALKTGNTTSCGCSYRNGTRNSARRHGHCTNGKKSKELSAYHNMHSRCYNPDATGYANWGGRGIQVDPRWHTPEQFLTDMGPAPKGFRASVERREDTHYSPENCYWGSDKEQQRNTRKNVIVPFNGVEACIAEHAEKTGIPYHVAFQRIQQLHWTPEKAFTTPVKKYRPRSKGSAPSQ